MYTYRNGNVDVVLYKNGTKVRTYDGEPKPVHPESVDVKITDYCDAGCAYCHEKSTEEGKHGDLTTLLQRLSDLPPGVELALGGGNPLSHPELIPFLQELRQRGLVPNMTVNQIHIPQITEEVSSLVYGMGLSVLGRVKLPEREHLVVHLIAGVNQLDDLDHYLALPNVSVLVLGYKTYGRGEDYYSSAVERRLNAWREGLPSRLRAATVSFDNLAIQQLRVRDEVTESVWNENYMGDDGTFTCYHDAVQQEFALSSTSPRHTPCSPSETIAQWFSRERD